MHGILVAIRKKDVGATQSTEFYQTADIKNVAQIKGYLSVQNSADFDFVNVCISDLQEKVRLLHAFEFMQHTRKWWKNVLKC